MDEQPISDIRIPAQGGEDEFVVIFFHGYGSSGQEMADFMGNTLSSAMPNAAVRFASAPLETQWEDGKGRSWFYIDDHLEGSADGNIMAPRALAKMAVIHDYIDAVLAEEGIDESRLILAGFSQGATMAFYAALQRENPVAGVFCISGGALDQVTGIESKPPVMLLAGAEESSYYSGREQAAKTHELLLQSGFRSELYLTPDNGHNIDENTINALVGFVQKISSRQAGITMLPPGLSLP